MHKKILTRVAAAVMLSASTCLTMAAVAHAAPLAPEQACAKSRYDAATKYAQCHGKALAKLFATNDLEKLQLALSKCRVKYTSTYSKLHKKALDTGSTCDNDRFVLNGVGGDETVTDNLTALEWVKFTVGPVTLNHAYDQSLESFNDPTCFANHCDWRLPTVAELQTLLSEPFPCTTSPCIDPAFGSTSVTDDYWSSTTLADNPNFAWGVFFGTGEVSYGLKSSTNRVRAVRGGL